MCCLRLILACSPLDGCRLILLSRSRCTRWLETDLQGVRGGRDSGTGIRSCGVRARPGGWRCGGRRVPCTRGRFRHREIDFREAHLELCRRHVRAFGPTTAETFGWWAGLSRPDARTVWSWLADELLPVELEGRAAAILAADEDAVRSAPAVSGARFLVASDLRLFGADRYGLFAGPGQKSRIELNDWHHPHGLMIHGQIRGAWGRRQGAIHLRIAGQLSAAERAAVEAEALSMPIPGADDVAQDDVRTTSRRILRIVPGARATGSDQRRGSGGTTVAGRARPKPVRRCTGAGRLRRG